MNPSLKVAALLLACAGVGGALWFSSGAKAQVSPYRTAPVKRGELLVTISATGTVEPEDVVDVGAQVAGRVDGFGNDDQKKPIDYGSQVEEGTVLARIDDSLYSAD